MSKKQSPTPSNQNPTTKPIPKPKPSTKPNLSEKIPEDEKILGRRFKVQFDVGFTPPKEKFKNETDTVPDMNLTVRQLFQMHTRGTDGNLQTREPLYFDHVIPTINDITDVDRYREMLQHQITEVDAFLKEEHEKFNEQEKARKAEAKAKQQEQKEFEEFKKSQNKDA